MTDILLLDHAPARIAELLAPGIGDARLHIASSADEALEMAPEIDLLFVMPSLLRADLVARLTRLRWIQTLSAGVDHLLALDIPAGVRISSAAGVHAPQMAELVFFQMLSLLRNGRAVLDNQRAHRWAPSPQPLLLGRRLLIVGVGKIGEELARRASAFGMRVTGASGGRTEAPGFSTMVPMAQLREAVANADIVVALTPYSERTHHLFDEHIFAAMPPHALFINAGRGKVVKQAALLDALRAKRIAGAALDVFETEPLPADSPLWDLPNLLVTPHIGGYSDIFPQQIAPYLLENLSRWREKRPLVNEIRR